MKKQIHFKLFDKTPGAFRYREVDGTGQYIKGDEEEALVGDLYLRKLGMPGAAPDDITVTIEY
jgi:hypothetical protein